MDKKYIVIMLAFLKAFPKLREDELIALATDSLYLDYFQAAAALANLKEQGLTSEITHKDETERDAKGRPVRRIVLNPAGNAVAAELSKQLPDEVRRYIIRRSREYHQMARTEQTAKIQAKGQDKTLLSLDTKEQGELFFHLDLLLPSREIAEKIKADWDANPAALYQKILSVLLGSD